MAEWLEFSRWRSPGRRGTCSGAGFSSQAGEFGMANMEDEIVQSLRRIVRAIDLHSRALSRDFELTWPQLAALSELERLGECPVGRLAAEMYVGAPTVTGVIDRLERDGLVKRFRAQQDRRKVLVTLTRRGKQLLAQNPSLLNEHLRKRLGQLSERQRKQMRNTLLQLAEMMEAPGEANGGAARRMAKSRAAAQRRSEGHAEATG
jgi:DNA-binding MarR family transcriptional regulator